MIYEFQATQDLHGYDKPWAPGANNNICETLDFSAVSGVVKGINGHLSVKGRVPSNIGATDIIWKNISFIADEEQQYYFLYSSGRLTGSSELFYDYDSVSTSHLTSSILEPGKYRVGIFIPAGTYDYDTIVQVSKTPQTSVVPYSNICPPEGFNIWDPDNAEYIQVYAGYVNANTRELYLRPVYEEYAGEELVGPWMSSLDEYSEDATPTEGAFVIDFGGELTSYEITPFMLQTLLDSLGIRQHFTDGAGLLNKLMDQAQGRVRSEEELLHLSRPLKVIAIGDQLPAGLTFKPISKDVLPGLPGKFIR